ncbi:MAG: DNA translocase FtsK, partial [Alphaproteobacteria bacterium]|nr:DNA translocase FtsK [Alphaproteobacteria bacterium]
MATISPSMQKVTLLPEGGRDFLRRRLMEIVGIVIAALGVMLLMAIFTFSNSDPSLNHATGVAPNNLLGLPGAYISDLLLQTFGLAIVLVPLALITWGVRMVRTHHLGFFGLRLSLLLLAVLMMSVACIGLGDVGGAATHAGPGGLVGIALIGRFRDLVLAHSSGGSLALIEPGCAALAFIAMAPALGMNRTDLPLIFRILRAPFLGGTWLMRAAVGLWRGRPEPLDEFGEPPGPEIGYAEIPGEVDASQYIPEEETPLPPRSSLLVDAPHAPIERPMPEIPAAPAALDAAIGSSPVAPAQLMATPGEPESIRERTLFDRLAGGIRIEPILGKLRPTAPPPSPSDDLPTEVIRTVLPPTAEAEVEAEREIDADAGIDGAEDENPFIPDALPAEAMAASAVGAGGVKIVPRKAAAQQGKRAARSAQRELDLGGDYQIPPLDLLSLPSRVQTETKIDESALEQNARLLETVLEDFGVKGQIVKVRPGPVVTLYELEPAPGTKASRVIGLADDIARSMSAVSARVATVPGRNVIGIELPNAKRETVFLRELLSTKHYEDGRLNLPLALGKDIGGDPVIADLARMPHLLIGG